MPNNAIINMLSKHINEKSTKAILLSELKHYGIKTVSRKDLNENGFVNWDYYQFSNPEFKKEKCLINFNENGIFDYFEFYMP